MFLLDSTGMNFRGIIIYVVPSLQFSFQDKGGGHLPGIHHSRCQHLLVREISKNMETSCLQPGPEGHTSLQQLDPGQTINMEACWYSTSAGVLECVTLQLPSHDRRKRVTSDVD